MGKLKIIDTGKVLTTPYSESAKKILNNGWVGNNRQFFCTWHNKTINESDIEDTCMSCSTSCDRCSFYQCRKHNTRGYHMKPTENDYLIMLEPVKLPAEMRIRRDIYKYSDDENRNEGTLDNSD